MRKIKKNEAFTLIEMVVAITIFTIFISIIAGTYLYIAKAQYDVGEVRKVYSGARDVMEQIVEEARLGMPYYDCYDYNPGMVAELSGVSECSQIYNLELSAVDTLVLLSQTGEELTTFSVSEEGDAFMNKYELGASDSWVPQSGYEEGALQISGADFQVDGLYFEISPHVNPSDNYDDVSVQLQPYLTVYMAVSGEIRNGERISYDLQTSVSTRIYE